MYDNLELISDPRPRPDDGGEDRGYKLPPIIPEPEPVENGSDD